MEKYEWKIVFLGDEGTKKSIKVVCGEDYKRAVRRAHSELLKIIPDDSIEIFSVIVVKRGKEVWELA